MIKNFTPLFTFNVSVSKEVDETATRIEGDKTITETVKIKRSVSVPFCLKTPSRAEREDADIERAVWETTYVNKGIMPQAQLLKVYANHGGILSDFDAKKYNQLQADFLLAEGDLKRLQVSAPDDKTAIEEAALRFVTLRQEIIDFQQQQSVFFSNTAEAKARVKLTEWVLLHLTYYKPVNAAGEPTEWTPFFAGKTTAEKFAALDEYAETQNELWAKSKSMLEFMATAWVSGGDAIDKDELEAYAATIGL